MCIAALELGCHLSQQISTPCSEFKLRVKGSDECKTFSLVSEGSLKGLRRCEKVSNFDMNKLEVEYDYDTDKEQIIQS